MPAVRKTHSPPPRPVLLSLRQPIWICEGPGRIEPTGRERIGVGGEDVGKPGAAAAGGSGGAQQYAPQAEAITSRFALSTPCVNSS
jgi:hypothetical protein